MRSGLNSTFMLSLTVLAVACSPGASGLRRPTSKQAIDCSTAGSSLQYAAEFTPGVVKNPVDNLFVTFRQRKPTSNDAAGALRTCIDVTSKTFRIDYEMLATAWFNDDGPLPLPDGSSELVFDPKTRAIKTWNEREGKKPAVTTRKGYNVEYTEDKSLVAPRGTSANLDVLFERAPAAAEITKVLVAEIKAASSQQATKLEISAYAKTGPATDRIAQSQVKAPSGKFYSARFTPKTGEIRDQDNRVVGVIK